MKHVSVEPEPETVTNYFYWDKKTVLSQGNRAMLPSWVW